MRNYPRSVKDITNMPQSDRKRSWKRNRNLEMSVTLYLRLALGTGLLSAVADRFGLWWRPGALFVAWGNFQNFLHYTAVLNPWLPASWIPSVGWITTACEAALGFALTLGLRLIGDSCCATFPRRAEVRCFATLGTTCIAA